MQAVFNFLKSLAWQNNLVNHITQLVSSSSLPCIPVVPQVLAVSLFFITTYTYFAYGLS